MSGAEQTRPDAWTRRRAAVQAEADMAARQEQKAVLAEHHEQLAELSEAEVLAELDLPAPESLEAGDDFSAFMKSTVPAAIRNRALRKLWLSNPVLANVDNLVDYGEDFAAEGKIAGVIKTAYRVGKGLLADEPEGTPDEVVEDEVVTANNDDGAPAFEPVAEAEVADVQPETAEIPQAAETIRPAIRPRMRFEFATTEQGRG